jgi:hypothetical protein
MASNLRALLGFAKYSVNQLLVFARGVHHLMKGNPWYPHPPFSMDQLQAKMDEISESIVGTTDGSRKAFAQRDKQADELRGMLVLNGQYVEFTAPDEAAFISSGYQLAASSRTQATPLNEAIRNIEWGENSGTFRFRFVAVDGADSYELRWAVQLEDGTPGEWTTKPFGKTKGYLTITGFTPGTRYMFQVRALIHTEYTDWSDAVTKICI